MFVIIGLVIVFGSIILGYTMHHGHLGVLLQVSEFIIILGSAFGAMMIGNSPKVLVAVFKQCLALLKGNPYTKDVFSELLLLLFELFQVGKRDGLLALEAHIERPHESSIFTKYPFFLHNHHAVSFLTDTLKVLLTGTVDRHNLAEILEVDLERHHEEAMVVPNVLAKVGDAMPGFGIVAAVLGVVVTMGSIGGAASEIGHKVAAALVGTFVGILFAYGVFAPLSQACEYIAKSEATYLGCIRTAVLAFAHGDPPVTVAEFARRSIDPGQRPTFNEVEELIRQQKG
jgi:chemotaxis protein MotA